MNDEKLEELSDKVDKLTSDIVVMLRPAMYQAILDHVEWMNSLPAPIGMDRTPNSWWRARHE